ncbi:uncharacterized protein LOC130665299 [Microplitis mediator]|uniref:uncharacterized protein LOC130665299 n=1 Tax=Microplitis mediator TaxID=375433 RepID=UPI00255366B6|nr:uncharacterized protein LOC130665299 [Microplitis mediator]
MTKITKGFIILLLMESAFSRLLIPRKCNRSLTSKWEVLIGRREIDQFFVCNGVFIDPHVFIMDAGCAQNSLSSMNGSQIFMNQINCGHAVTEDKEVNKDDIYYNDNFSKSYDRSRLQIAMLIIKNFKETQFVSLPNNTFDVSLSKCYISQPNGVDVKLKRCYLINYVNNGTNDYYSHIECFTDATVISGNTVICGLKSDPEVKVLAGLISEHRESRASLIHELIVTIENVSHLRSIMNSKIESLSLL